MLLLTEENLDNNSSENEVNFSQLKLSVDNYQGAQDISSIVKDYTENTQGLSTTFEKINPLLKERTVKIRYTKIIDKLKKIHNSTPNRKASQMNIQEEDLEYIDSDENLDEN